MNVLRLSQMVMIHQAHEMEVETVGEIVGRRLWERGRQGGGDCGKEAEPHERQ